MVLSDIQHVDMDTLTLINKLRKVENNVPVIVTMRDFDLDILTSVAVVNGSIGNFTEFHAVQQDTLTGNGNYVG